MLEYLRADANYLKSHWADLAENGEAKSYRGGMGATLDADGIEASEGSITSTGGAYFSAR